jgi:hypothetical protein
LLVKTWLYVVGAAVVLIGLAASLLSWGVPHTAEACIGGLASYSKETTEKGGNVDSHADIDVSRLKANLDAAAKNTDKTTVLTSTDPAVQRISQFCWQYCQAWANTSGAERETLFQDFRSCMKEARAQGMPDAGAAKGTPAPPAPPASAALPAVTQTAGDHAVQIVGTGNVVGGGATPSTSLGH